MQRSEPWWLRTLDVLFLVVVSVFVGLHHDSCSIPLGSERVGARQWRA